MQINYDELVGDKQQATRGALTESLDLRGGGDEPDTPRTVSKTTTEGVSLVLPEIEPFKRQLAVVSRELAILKGTSPDDEEQKQLTAALKGSDGVTSDAATSTEIAEGAASPRAAPTAEDDDTLTEHLLASVGAFRIHQDSATSRPADRPP